MSSNHLSIAFSPCPNDTFIFGPLVNKQIPETNINFREVVLEDIETLNRLAFKGIYDITKISFHAYGHVSDKYVLLSSGSALGKRCGPLLIANKGHNSSLRSLKIAIPGRYTTAAMLLKLFMPSAETVEMRFDEIMRSVVRGDVDAGVIIHESRFTYKKHGLVKVEDLGEWWEKHSGCPIPLGGIAIKRSLALKFYNQVNNAISKSISWAHDNYTDCLPYITKFAQEMDDSVIDDHISLYVNDYTQDLGNIGELAILKFLENGNQTGLFRCDLDNIFRS